MRIQQFSDCYRITFNDEKYENQVKNIFLQDNLNILKNISSKIEESSNTIVAKRFVESGQLVLLNGKLFQQKFGKKVLSSLIKLILFNIVKNTTIKKQKLRNFNESYKMSKNFLITNVQQISRRNYSCLNKFIFMFIPVLALVSSLY